MSSTISATLFLLALSFAGKGQELKYLHWLNDTLKESSGLIYLDQRLITHADSYNPPALYEIDTVNGKILRTVLIENASNKDWEDITHDEKYIYIGDFGNNSGNRKDLRVYRISIQDYLNTPNNRVFADTIAFTYPDQKIFNDREFHTNFDAEALIALKDSLYIFTKNWGDFKTNIYSIPKTPGQYKALKRDSLDVRCLVTAASYSPTGNSLQLTCQIATTAFFIEIKDIENIPSPYKKIEKIRLKTPLFISWQIESITPAGRGKYYITAEGGYTGKAALFKFIEKNK